MKTEYDLSTMKRRGHPLREKILLGEFKPINPTEIPNRETKLAELTPSEREFVIGILEVKNGNRKTNNIK